jgi:microcystin degradation protein MlrC
MTDNKSGQPVRVMICAFHQETNSFNPIITDMARCKYGVVGEGEALLKMVRGKPFPVTGMVDAIEELGGEAMLAQVIFTQSGGVVDHPVVETFLQNMKAAIQSAGRLDGIFITLHGATQSTQMDDVCGYILETLRAVAPDAVIAASCDLHANITAKMLDNSDYICGYWTYPHEDLYQTGTRAARLGMAHITGGGSLYAAHVGVPMIAPANGYNTTEGEFKEVMDYGRSLVDQGTIVDFSVFHMQPWLDVAEGGSSTLVIAKDQAAAKKYAAELAQRLWDIREACQVELWPVDDVIDFAIGNNTGKPVVLVDSSDSTNAGATGDSAAVLKRLYERGFPVKTAFVLDDAAAVKKATETGIGKSAAFILGGTRPELNIESIETQAYVVSLHDGIFAQEGPTAKGIVVNIGPSAVLRVGNVDVLVCHHTMGNGDPQLYRHFGMEPLAYDMVVVKACTSFRAAYEPIAAKICVANTPGVASSDLAALPFKKLPKNFYPFSHMDDYKISEPVVWDICK